MTLRTITSIFMRRSVSNISACGLDGELPMSCVREALTPHQRSANGEGGVTE
jgi:hypothetical protein